MNPFFRLRAFDRLSCLLLCVVVTVALSAASVVAQTGWSVVEQTATKQDLWSIAYGGGTLVAVGQGGTLITRDDATGVWVPQTSGTNVWLVGVGYGNSRFIVVGDSGTILTSDDNGVTWTPRTSGTSTRLNAVAYGGGIWVAVGEQGVVLTSADGTTWSSHPALSTGFLRALAYGQGRFLIGGANGVLYTTTDGATFTAVASGTTSNIEGAAISSTHFWIVGSNGLWASATALGAWAYGPNTTTTTFRGVAARNVNEAVTVAENGAGVFRNEAWAADSPPPPFLATAVTQGNNEMIAVGLSGGIARADVTPQPTLTVNGSRPVEYRSDVRVLATHVSDNIPATYQWYDATGTAIPGANGPELDYANVTPETAHFTLKYQNAYGSGAVGVTVPLYPAGQIDVRDPSFTSALPRVPNVVVLQPDGKLLVAGPFSLTIGGSPTYGLARLNVDGSIDTSFRAGVGIPTTSSIGDFIVLPDGRIYVRGSFSSIAGQPRPGLARLLANGDLDAGFQPTPLTGSVSNFAATATGTLYIQVSGNISRLNADGSTDSAFPAIAARLLGLDSQSRLLAASSANVPQVFRYTADGILDPSYVPGYKPAPVYFDFIRVRITDNGMYASYPTGLVTPPTVIKYAPNGGSDPTYNPPRYTPASGSLYDYSFDPVLRSDGGVWAFNGGTATSYSPTGVPENNKYATVPSEGDVWVLATASDGSLYAAANYWGDFIHIRPVAGRAGVLTNLSARAFVPGADQPLIAGFVTSGTGNTTTVIRGVGPTLATLGVSDPMPNPSLRITRDGTDVASNDDWASALASRFTSVGAFSLPLGSTDAALESTIGTGNYTAVVLPASGGPGTALAELYQSEDAFAATRHLINISARATVDASHPLIAGFVIAGDVPQKVLIRASGPALAVSPFNLSNTLANPYLTLYRGSAAIWDNDNWDAGSSTDTLAITAAANQVGAFPLASRSKDSAMLVTLAPGAYTAVVTSADGTSGTALVEVYAAH